MRLNILGGRSLLRTAAVAATVLAAGCGGGGEAADTNTSVSPASSNQPTTTTSATSEPSTSTSDAGVTGTRSSISTTSTAQTADTEITREFVAESTTSYEVGPTSVNGVSYVTALQINSGRTPQKLEINAGRNRNRFLGTLGIPDDQRSSSSHQVEISLDNAAPVLSVLVNFGEAKPIDIDVTKVLRVRITVTSKTSDSGTIAIGDPRFA